MLCSKRMTFNIVEAEDRLDLLCVLTADRSASDVRLVVLRHGPAQSQWNESRLLTLAGGFKTGAPGMPFPTGIQHFLPMKTVAITSA